MQRTRLIHKPKQTRVAKLKAARAAAAAEVEAAATAPALPDRFSWQMPRDYEVIHFPIVPRTPFTLLFLCMHVSCNAAFRCGCG